MSTPGSFFEAAQATPLLGGRKIAPRNALTAAVVAVAAGGIVSLAVGAAAGFGGFAAGLLVAVVAIVVLSRSHNHGIRRINEGAKLIGAGEYDAAARVLVPLATSRQTVTVVSFAVYNLGAIALRTGDVPSAIVLYRAALALYRSQRIASLRAGAHLARSSLAFAYACDGQLDAAERTLAEPVEVEMPQMLASEAVTRALVSLRRGDAGAALSVLDRERKLLRSTAGGDSSSLQEAIEASALEALGGLHDGQPRAVSKVPVDPEARAYVLRALPGCEPFLVDA